MNDCQIVLRFFALQDDSSIKGSMRSILDNCMKQNKTISKEEIKKRSREFKDTIRLCTELIGSNPFNLPPNDREREITSIALYDALMVALYRSAASTNSLIKRKDEIKARVQAAVTGDLELFTGKANTAQAVKDRIHRIIDIVS